MHSGLQDEEILELLWKESWWTLREGVKSLKNHHVEPPWRTPLNKRMIKRKERVVENTRWNLVRIYIDLRDNIIARAWNSGKERWALEAKNMYDEPLRNKELNQLDERRIRITLCLSFTNLNWWQSTDLAYYFFPLKGLRDIAQTWEGLQRTTGRIETMNELVW